jgi:hypothetical protein
MLHHVGKWIIADISEESSTSIFRVQSTPTPQINVLQSSETTVAIHQSAQYSRPTESHSAPLWIPLMSHTFTFIQLWCVTNFEVFVTTVFYKILSDRQPRRVIQIHKYFRDKSVSWRWKRSLSPKRWCIRITWCGCRPEKILQHTVC